LRHFVDSPKALDCGVETACVSGVLQSTIGFCYEGFMLSNVFRSSEWARVALATGGRFRSYLSLFPVDRGLKGSGRASCRCSRTGGGHRVEEDVCGRVLSCFICMM